MAEDCPDWKLRDKLLSILENKGKNELFEAIKVITEYIEGTEDFNSLICLFEAKKEVNNQNASK